MANISAVRRLRDSQTEKRLVDRLRHLPESRAFLTVRRLIALEAKVGLQIANKVLRDPRYLEQLLYQGLISGNESTTKLWLHALGRRLGQRRLSHVLNQVFDRCPEAKERIQYWLPSPLARLADHNENSLKTTADTQSLRGSATSILIKAKIVRSERSLYRIHRSLSSLAVARPSQIHYARKRPKQRRIDNDLSRSQLRNFPAGSDLSKAENHFRSGWPAWINCYGSEGGSSGRSVNSRQPTESDVRKVDLSQIRNRASRLKTLSWHQDV